MSGRLPKSSRGYCAISGNERVEEKHVEIGLGFPVHPFGGIASLPSPIRGLFAHRLRVSVHLRPFFFLGLKEISPVSIHLAMTANGFRGRIVGGAISIGVE